MTIKIDDRHEYQDSSGRKGSQHLLHAHYNHPRIYSFHRTSRSNPITTSTLFVMKLVCLCLLVSSFVDASQVGSDKKEEKLISILENLQLSIQEILHTIGSPSSPSSSSPSSLGSRVPGRAGGSSSSSSILSKQPPSGLSSRPPYSQRPEAGGKDYPTSSSGQREGKSSTEDGPSTSIGGSLGGNGLSSDRDSPPTGRPGSASGSGDTFTPPKKFGSGLPFRVSMRLNFMFEETFESSFLSDEQCAATYAGSYGHEYEKPSLHHTSHYGVSSNHDFTPHMIEAKWNAESGWDPAFIVPHQNISLYPSAKVLMHGQQVYDVLQALMGFDNRIRMFRPNLHLDRLRRSAGRLGLPDFDANEMIICLKRLILTDASFLPPSYSNGSIELRLVMMGVDDDLRFKPAEDVLLYIFANRHTANTVAEITKPQSVFADSQYSRSPVGGIGEFMSSANDASTLLVNQIAQSQGYNNVLWLHSKEELITSLNDAAVFVFIINELGKRELITPPLNGLIVPGVVRQTILEMTRHWVCIPIFSAVLPFDYPSILFE